MISIMMFMNSTTLTYVEFKHAQLQQHMAKWVWSKGMADRNTRFMAPVALLERLEGRFSHIPDTVMISTSGYDA